MVRTINIILIVVIVSSCNSTAPIVSSSRSDTVQIIQTLIDSNLNLPWLVDFQRLWVSNPFGDTIIVKADTLLYKNWPSYYKFKFLTIDSICALSFKYKDSTDFPNFLQFKIWKENDSIYVGQIMNFKIENRNNCIYALNNGCLKRMTFKKTGQGLIPKREETLYD